MWAHDVQGTLGLMSALTNAASAGLMCLLAWRMFRARSWTIVAVVLFVTTPLFVAHFSVDTPPVRPLPFVLGWLLCVEAFTETSDRRWLLAAGAVLGAGVYTHPVMWVMVPAYAAVTLAVLAWWGEPLLTAALTPIACIAVASPLIVSLMIHPELLTAHIDRLGLYDTRRFDLLHGLREMSSWVGLTARSEVYHDYFNPAFLFVSGSTAGVARPAVFLLPMAVLLPVGLVHLALREQSVMNTILLAGFLTSPLAASLPAEPNVGRRILVMVPFAVLIATCGAKQLAGSKRLLPRLCGIALLVAVPIGFVVLTWS